MYFVENLRTITQEGSMETRQMTPFFLPTFSNLFVIFTSEFENPQNSFLCGPLVGPFWSVKYLIFWPKATNSDSSSHFSRKQTLYISFPMTRHTLCTALFLTLTTNSIKSGKMETGSKSASKHSKTLFFVNIKSISIKEVNLSTKGHRHILKGQSKNEKLLKKTPLKQY